MIVWVRGPSGSGKSTVAHAFLDMFPESERTEVWWPAGVSLPTAPGKENPRKKPRLVGYELPGDLFVLGPYHVPGGGLDLLGGSVLKTQIPLVERSAAKYAHVFCESLTAGNVVPERFAEMKERLLAAGIAGEVFMPVLDTTLDACIESVYERQIRRTGKTRKFNEDVVRLIGKRVHMYQARAAGVGLDAPLLDRTIALETVVRRLKEAGWVGNQ